MATGRSYPLSLIITGVDRFTAPLRLANQKLRALTEPVTAVSNRFSALGRARDAILETTGVTALRDKWDGVSDAVGNVNSAVQTTIGRVTKLTAVGAAAAYGFKRIFLDAAADAETMRIRMVGLEGTPEKARASIAFVKRMSDTTAPFDREALTDAFAMLRMKGMDPTQGSLQAIVDQVSKIAPGKADSLIGVTRAFTQMLGKGKFTAEEAQQLAEQQVDVWGLLQRAFERQGRKVSLPQLMKASQDSQLGKGAILQILEQMGRESAGQGARAMDSGLGLQTRILNKWLDFRQQLMGDGNDGGPFQSWKDGLKELLAWIDKITANGQLKAWADQTGTAIRDGIEWGRRAIPELWQGIQTLGGWVKWIADLCGGWGNLLKVGLALFIGGPLMVAIAGLIGAIAAFGAGIMLTPIGWFLGALALMAAAATLLIVKWGAVKAFFADFFGGLADGFSGLIDIVKAVVTGDWTGDLMVGGIKKMAAGFARSIGTVLKTAFNASPVGIAVNALVDWQSKRNGAAPDAPALVPPKFAPGVLPSNEPPSSMAGTLARLDTAVQQLGKRESNVRVDVGFSNAPRGLRVTSTQSAPGVDLRTRLSWGLSMAESH